MKLVNQYRPALLAFLALLMVAVAAPHALSAQDNPKDAPLQDPTLSRLSIDVTGVDGNKPVSNASVYIRWDETSGLLHKKKQAELDFKTNEDGSVKVPEVPKGKILIQIVAQGWHTFGKYYDIEKDEETIQIKLDKPPRWY